MDSALVALVGESSNQFLTDEKVASEAVLEPGHHTNL